MTRVYLSLGSNMGDRQGYLQKAVKALNDLPETEVKAVSSYYETAAWGLTDQADFLNLALALETKLPAETLLRSCQQIEKDLDRVRHEHWGPRTVDIDILLYGQEIADDLVDPKTGQAYKNYLSHLNTSDVRKLELMD